MVAAPVPFTDDPRQDVDLVMEVGGELGADEVGRPGAFSAADELHAVVVATVLRRQRGGLQRQHGADAVARRGLVDFQPLLGAAGVFPPEVPLRDSVVHVRRAVRHLGGVGAGAAGEVIRHLGHVLLQKVALAVHPALTAVGVCEEREVFSRCSSDSGGGASEWKIDRSMRRLTDTKQLRGVEPVGSSQQAHFGSGGPEGVFNT